MVERVTQPAKSSEMARNRLGPLTTGLTTWFTAYSGRFNDGHDRWALWWSYSRPVPLAWAAANSPAQLSRIPPAKAVRDRKSTRLNSSHLVISYAVFCLKKKKKKHTQSHKHPTNHAHENKE